MSNHPVPSGDRCTAAFCWWMGFLWILIYPLANVVVPLTNLNLIWTFLFLVSLPVPGLLLIALGQWVLIRTQESGFVDRCGRQALNNTLSIALYILIMLGILIVSCGIPAAMDLGIGYGALCLIGVLMIFHFLEVLFASILALQGKCYFSAWSILFFRDRY